MESARSRLPISDNWIFLASSPGCITIKRNLSKSAFSEGGGSLWAQILGGWGRRPQSIYGPLDRQKMSLQLYCWKFSHDETLQQTFFDRSSNLLEKIANSHFVPPLCGIRGNVHGSSVARWKARGRLPTSANWTFFASSYAWGAMCGYWSKFRCSKGGGSLWAQISGVREGRPPTNFGVKKLESLGYHAVLFAWSYV